MKFKIKNKTFEKNLLSANSFINKANKLPTLSNALIEAKDNSIIITATDLVVEGIFTIKDNIEILEEGSILTNTSKLLNIIKLSDQDEVTLETEGTSLILSDETSTYELYTYDSSNFSKFSVEDEQFNTFFIKKTILEKALKETYFTVKTVALKKYFTGISIRKIESNIILFSGTDNFRLSTSFIKTDTDIPFDLDILLPKRTAKQIITFLENFEEENIEIKFSDKFLSISMDNLTINSKLIEDKFPDITHIVNHEFPNYIEVNSSDFFKVFKKSAIFTNDGNKSVVVNLEKSKMTLFSEDSSSGRSKNILPVTYEFEPINFAIKPSHILEIENHFLSEKIIIRFENLDLPFLIEDSNNPNFKYFIQPTDI